MDESQILKILKQVDTFDDVPEEQLKWLIQNSEVSTLQDGDTLFTKGSPIIHMYVVLEGKFVVKIEQGGNFRTLGEFAEKSITGGLPYSRAKNAIGYAFASGKSSVLALPIEFFEELIRNHFELCRALVHFMTSRVREFTKQQQQNDKMAALGKLSAGLAHELNNPSAAVVRSSQSLKNHLAHLPDKFKAVINIKMTEDQIDTVNNLLYNHISKKPEKELSMMEKAEREDEIMEWLDNNDVEDADEIAENLIEFDFDESDLDTMAEQIPQKDRSAVLNWLNQVLNTEKMVQEIEDAASRINDLVVSIKSYTHMDQSPEKKKVDIHQGINNTITMLQHKIKKENIQLNKEYAEDLPEPEVLVSELNQVWTNLIDNAIDAMKNSEQKKLTVSTRKDGEYIKIHIIDSGTGIPEEEQGKIFDPFFTTKKIGEGTGLGLDVVQQIMKQHNGSVRVKSSPGNTDFEICIPI